VKKVFSNYALIFKYKLISENCAGSKEFLHRNVKNCLRKTVLLLFFYKTVLETVPKAVSNHQIFL